MQRGGARFLIGTAGVMLLALSLAPAVHAAGFTFRSLITLESEVPTGAKIIGDFEVGNLNSAGQATTTTDFDIGGEGGLFFDTDGKITVLSQYDMDSPGGGTFTGGGHSHNMPLNDAGNIAFTAEVDRGSSRGGEVLFYDRAANKWTVVMQPGVPVPGGGEYTGNDSFVAMNNANEIVIPAKVTESSAGPAGTALVLYSGGKLTTLVRPGAKVPAGTLNQCFRPHISDSGIVTFEGRVDGGSDYGAYAVRDGQVIELATPGGSSPGSDRKFNRLRGIQANSSGDVIMIGRLEGDDHGVYLWSAADRALKPIVVPGQELPGIGTVASADGGGRNSVRLREDGAVLFVAEFEDGSEALCIAKDGQFSTVLKSGEEMKTQDGKSLGTARTLFSANFEGKPSYGIGANSKGQFHFAVATTDGEVHLVLATPTAP
jgi:hypothetical protein